MFGTTTIKVLISCTRKKSLTKELADKIVDQQAQRGIVYYYYKCTLCCSYHMTSKPPLEHPPIEVI